MATAYTSSSPPSSSQDAKALEAGQDKKQRAEDEPEQEEREEEATIRQAEGEEGDLLPEPWQKGLDPMPPTTDIQFTCGDVIEEGAAGYQVLLLVSAAFTDSLLHQIALILDDLPVGVLVGNYLECKWKYFSILFVSKYI